MVSVSRSVPLKRGRTRLSLCALSVISRAAISSFGLGPTERSNGIGPILFAFHFRDRRQSALGRGRARARSTRWHHVLLFSFAHVRESREGVDPIALGAFRLCRQDDPFAIGFDHVKHATKVRRHGRAKERTLLFPRQLGTILDAQNRQLSLFARLL